MFPHSSLGVLEVHQPTYVKRMSVTLSVVFEFFPMYLYLPTQTDTIYSSYLISFATIAVDCCIVNLWMSQWLIIVATWWLAGRECDRILLPLFYDTVSDRSTYLPCHRTYNTYSRQTVNDESISVSNFPTRYLLISLRQ